MSLALVAALAAALVLGASWTASRRRVVAIRDDPDFGRISLFGDGRWRGTVELGGVAPRVDLEIEAGGGGPSLRHRLAYRDALSDLPGLLPSIARGAAMEDGERFRRRTRFLTLRLPEDGELDWSLSFVLSEEASEGYEVGVREGRIVDFYSGS